MINLLVLFPKSIDAERSAEILSNLIQGLKPAEGVLSLKVSEGHLMRPDGPPSFNKVLEVAWRTLQDMMAWTETPAANDEDKDFLLENGGIMLFYEVKEL